MNERSIQSRIESIMREFANEGRWQAIYLFSSEGLPMAGINLGDEIPEDRLLEFAFSLIQTRDLLKETDPAGEILIKGRKNRMVFTFFTGLESELILAAAVRGRKGYRRAMARLIKTIQESERH